MLLRQVCASWTPNYSHHVEKLQNVLVITNSFVWKQRATAKANMSSHSALNILHHGKQFWKGCITIIIINTMVNCLTYKTQNNQVPFTMFSLNGFFDGELIFGIVLYFIFCLIGCCMVCPSLTVWVLYGSPKCHCLGSVWFAQVSRFGFCMVCPSVTVWLLYGSPKSQCTKKTKKLARTVSQFTKDTLSRTTNLVSLEIFRTSIIYILILIGYLRFLFLV